MNDEHHIFDTARSLRMTDAERSRVREKLLAHMDAHPSTSSTSSGHSVVSPYAPFLAFLARPMMIVPLALVLIVTLGAGTAFAAEGALPGDTLYAVKIQVNERIEFALANTDVEKAAVAARHALARLDEAKELALRGRLDATTSSEVDAQLAANVTVHANAVERLADKGDFAAAGQATISFESALSEGYAALLSIATTSTARSSASLAHIATAVRRQIDATSDQGIVAQRKQLANADENAQRDAALAALTNAEDALAMLGGSSVAAPMTMSLKIAPAFSAASDTFVTGSGTPEAASSTTVSPDAQSRIDMANEYAAEGRARLDAGAYGDAFILFKKASRAAADAQLLLHVSAPGDQNDSDGEVKGANTSTIQTLPPSTSTSAPDAQNGSGVSGSSSGSIKIRLGI